MRPTPSILAALLCAACALPDVVLTGTANDHQGDKSGPLNGGALVLFDEDRDEHDRTTTGSQGRFELLAPEGRLLFVEVDHPEGGTASFTGQAGLNPEQQVPRGTWYGVPDWQRQGWEELFAGCEGLADGGLVVGQVHVFVPGVEVGEQTVVNAARVSLLVNGDDTDAIPACHLDEEGAGYDPSATRTGASGMYLIPGVPIGLHTLLVEFEFAEGVFSPTLFTVWMPADGVAPRFPSLVELPGTR